MEARVTQRTRKAQDHHFVRNRAEFSQCHRIPETIVSFIQFRSVESSRQTTRTPKSSKNDRLSPLLSTWRPEMNRRRFLGQSAVAAGVVAGLGTSAFAQSSTPVVETTYGKIRGRVINRVNAFQGIPYGSPTSGASRLMPASKPKAWASVLDTVEWGPEAPQGPHTEIPEVAE